MNPSNLGIFILNLVLISGQNVESEREGKFFSFPFPAVVTFGQTPCQTTSGDMGVCMKSSQCTRAGGVASGPCSQGIGSCCAFTKQCTSDPVTVTTSRTYLVQPDQGNFTEYCRYEIQKPPTTGGNKASSSEVCQVRLDFIAFSIEEGPLVELTGRCDVDTLTISGGDPSPSIGSLCGRLDGQHMYINYGSNNKINLDIYQQADSGQTWRILVTMIQCNSPDRAPIGCLQYFTGQRGSFQSFNYLNMHQLNDQDYSVCIRANSGMSKIMWKTCGGANDFFISLTPVVPPDVGMLKGDACQGDWVMIYGVDKYCGTGFPDGGVTASTQPFLMQVHMDGIEADPVNPSDSSNVGFCFNYTQMP